MYFKEIHLLEIFHCKFSLLINDSLSLYLAVEISVNNSDQLLNLRVDIALTALFHVGVGSGCNK